MRKAKEIYQEVVNQCMSDQCFGYETIAILAIEAAQKEAISATLELAVEKATADGVINYVDPMDYSAGYEGASGVVDEDSILDLSTELFDKLGI